VSNDRWQKLGAVNFSKEYCAGLIAGTGFGLILAIAWFDFFLSEQEMLKDFLRLIALFLIAGGGIWASSIQQKKSSKR
jgi:multisubunit Na+/H+ antiporter MnhE subunit